jgi:glyoxylase-like metal-dependent hydrolase (beta-lactamase superfamily II)
MKQGFRLGEFELFWLRGGRFALDGGAMFGVVPKVLWSKKYPSDEDNLVPLLAWPILVRTPRALVLVESGLGNKLTEKQQKIYRVNEPWLVMEDLAALGIERDEIDYVLLTHFDFDHAGGVVMRDENGGLSLSFPKATHILQRAEWEDVLNPTRRSANTFWPVNYEVLKDGGRLELVEGDFDVTDGVRALHTGGHNRGHQAVRLESEGHVALHMADLLPTHAHLNPLWIMALDNFPLDAIKQKEALLEAAVREDAWLTFYHDPFMLACKPDGQGGIKEKWTA